MAPIARVATAELVQWMIEQPDLVAVVQHLDARSLERLVEYVGLEDVGEIVALTTTAQLERVFDEELWRSEPTGDDDDSFDARRFGLWLEILLEACNEVAVEKIATMNKDLLALGLLKHVFVFDLDAVAAAMSESQSDEHDLIEQALVSCLYERIGEFRVIARQAIRWDRVLTLLRSLDTVFLRRLLERCCAATRKYVEDNGGLYDVLTSEQILEADVAADLKQFRQREGFVPPATAASFLRLARSRTLPEITAARGYDPITRAHFRTAPGAVPIFWASRTTPKVEAFLRGLGAAEATRLQGHAPLVPRAMQTLHAEAPDVFSERFLELTYLVNVLVAVSQGADQPPRTIEAIDAARTVCDLGIARLVDESGMQNSADDRMLAYVVRKHGLVKAFRVGWHLVGDERWTAEGLRDVTARASRLLSPIA